MAVTASRTGRSIVIALIAVAILAGVVWIVMLNRPVPTVMGWTAKLTTVAGDGIRGHVDGAASQSRFSDPFALAIDDNGILYVADAGDTNRIRKIGTDGHVTTLPGTFDTPSGLAIAPSGDIIVADTGANAIRKISPSGAVTTLAGGLAAGFRDGAARRALFNGPIGVAVDAEGTVYVADSYNDRIRSITPDGQVRTLAGGAAPGFADGQGESAAFDTPCGLVVEPGGTILVADTGNDAIRRLEKDGHVSTIARSAREDRAGILRTPVGLARTWDGFVYISSYRRGRILQMSPAGDVRILAGIDATTPGNALARTGSPMGLALDRDGALYITDAARYAVRKLSPRDASEAPELSDLQDRPPALVHAATFPWPVKSQTAWHEVVGTLGEVRGNYDGEARDHLHSGLDISAGVGVPVVAVADEKVVEPLPNWGVNGLSEGLRIDAMTYIHMRVGRTAAGTPLDPGRFQLLHDARGTLIAVRVRRGTRFRIGDTLGTVNRMAHVHLELGPPGRKVNALALRFTGLTDHVAPHIDDIHIVDAAGRRLTRQRDRRLIVPADIGPLRIVVDAWDQVDRNAPRRRLGLYRAGFQILRADGSPTPGFETPRIAIDFDRMPLNPDAARLVYAEASGDSVHSAQPTRFLYVVTNRMEAGRVAADGWNPRGLGRGDYTIRILAADHAGNVARSNRDLSISVE